MTRRTPETTVTAEQLTKWAESCLRMNHLGTLVQREIRHGSRLRALALAERARRRACTMFNEMIDRGAEKPDGYAEPGDEI